MPSTVSTKLRRLGARVGVPALVLASGVVGAAFVDGRNAWPEAYDEAPAPITWTVADVEAHLAAQPPGTPLRVAVVGDVQNGLSEFARLLDALAEKEPDLILLLGDCVNVAADGRYAALRRVVREGAPNTPVLAVPGNHDLDADETAVTYSRWMGATTWQLDLGGWRIVGLDDANGPLTPASLELLESATAAPPTHGVILAAHRPIGGPADVTNAMRRQQVAGSGVLASTRMTLQGHTHHSGATTDDAGTRHLHLGSNCDRSRDTPADQPVVAYMLEPGASDVSVEQVSVARGTRFVPEMRRLLITDVYARLRRSHAIVTLH